MKKEKDHQETISPTNNNAELMKKKIDEEVQSKLAKMQEELAAKLKAENEALI